MSGVNNKNKRVIPIAGLLLCIFYVAFVAFSAVQNSSIDWQTYGREYYDNGPKSPNMRFVFMVTITALPYVIPWIIYFLNRSKIDYKLGKGFAVFTILLTICHLFTWFPPCKEIDGTGYGPGGTYYDLESYWELHLLAMTSWFFGTIVYIIVSIRMLIKIKRDKDNITLAESPQEREHYV